MILVGFIFPRSLGPKIIRHMISQIPHRISAVNSPLLGRLQFVALSSVNYSTSAKLKEKPVPTKPEEIPIEPPSLSGKESEKTFPPHICELVEKISHLTLLEVADLCELLQQRLNIKAPAAFATTIAVPGQVSASATPDTGGEQQTAVKTSFTVRLVKFDAAKKVQLIKEIKRILPELNLVQAKKFVESAPGNVKVDVSKEEADEIGKALEAAGGTVEVE
ncbi:unnamed protein product [Calicophoron daubneyi]|uniref:39S ribosomal protein L12, mitochondrial n=1 Tax=Calicophoron daubneyi TaxID=300641 RepID=A0AAV2TXC3_CALDB